jgi:asparagine synthase (glutamine-hydrolysing)
MDDIQRQSPTYLHHFFRTSGTDLGSALFSHLPRWDLTAKIKLFYSMDVRSTMRHYVAKNELEAELPPEYSSWPYFNQAEYLEAKYLLPGYILSSQGDRMAMAHSVEARHPFLDHRVVEFAAKLPRSLKMKVLKEKYLLKRAFSKCIPPSIERRPKQPYRAPEGKCFLEGSFISYAQELLSTKAVEEGGLFDSGAVTGLVEKFKTGRAAGVKDNMALIGILSTQLVVDQFTKQRKGSSTYADARY